MSAQETAAATRKRKKKEDGEFFDVSTKSNIQFIKKIVNLKNALKFLRCEFDEYFLQVPGLLAAFTAYLEAGSQNAPINHMKFGLYSDENKLLNQLPPVIYPTKVGLNGLTNPTPLSFSFTWTRFQPNLEKIETDPGHYGVVLKEIIEPEVLIVLNKDQITEFLVEPIHENSTLKSFGMSLTKLDRPVTCIFFVFAKYDQTKKIQSTNASNSFHSKLNKLCIELQLYWNVQATRICTTVKDLAAVLYSYHRSVAERPFKDGRLGQDDGLAFLPDAHRKTPHGIQWLSRISSSDRELNLNLVTSTWLSQLGQWRGLTGDIADALTTAYPTPRSFYLACKKAQEKYESGLVNSNSCISGKNEISSKNSMNPFVKELSELEIRRGAGVLATSRRLGPEFARRLYTFFISDDPSKIID